MPCLDPPPSADLDEAALALLVNHFYARLRRDEQLGPVFAGAIAEQDWPAHLERMTRFWSSVMLGTGRYHGQPVAAHMQHREAMDPSLFARWLMFWEQSARACLSPQDAIAVISKAHRIAESLQIALFFRLRSARGAA